MPTTTPITTLDVVGFDEHRDIEHIRDATGRIIDLVPVPHSETCVLTFRTSWGREFKVPVPPDMWDTILEEVHQNSRRTLWDHLGQD